MIEIGQESYFIQIFPPKSQMLIIGAAHISAELVRLAKLFDFETIVIDPRTTFAEKTTFPVAPDQIHDCYPNEILNDFALDSNQKTSKFFRIYNEIPTLILIVVIFVVIFKPL